MNPALLALILTQAQTGCLNSAYNAGEIYGLAKTFRAVVLVESSGCVNELGDDGRSVGPAQIQVHTATIACGFSGSSDKLQDSHKLNLDCGAKFLALCFANFWPDKRRSLYCYNVGIPAASKATDYQVRHSRYVKKVESAVRALEGVKQNHE